MNDTMLNDSNCTVYVTTAVVVFACQNLQSTEYFGKNDVFVELRCGEQFQKTCVLPSAGEAAVFQPVEAFRLYVIGS